VILTGFAQADNYDPGPVRADESETPRPRLQRGVPRLSIHGPASTSPARPGVTSFNAPNPATVSPNHFIGDRPNNRKESKLKKTFALLFSCITFFLLSMLPVSPALAISRDEIKKPFTILIFACGAIKQKLS
jgi:hypothetical protein